MHRQLLIISLALASLNANAANYSDALSHAADAAYIQTGVKANIDRELGHLEKMYVDKDLERYAGTLAAIVKTLTDHQITLKWSF